MQRFQFLIGLDVYMFIGGRKAVFNRLTQDGKGFAGLVIGREHTSKAIKGVESIGMSWTQDTTLYIRRFPEKSSRLSIPAFMM